MEAEKARKQEEVRIMMLWCTGFKVLYLYGYANSEQLVRSGPIWRHREIPQGGPDRRPGRMAPAQPPEGFCEHRGQPPRAGEDVPPGGRGAYCYAPIEVPPESEDDFTAYLCKAQNTRFAKASKKDVDKACDKVVEHVVKQGGYDMIMGFSCGGEIVAQLVGRLSEINRRADRPTKAITLMGTRCLYKKYGEPLDNVPVGIKAAIIHGHEDDEERPPWTEDNTWDMKEFESKFKAAGMDVLSIVFGGGHETPGWLPTDDPVYTPWKSFLEPLFPKQEAEEEKAAEPGDVPLD